MGMFDYYEPSEEIHCPNCNAVLDGWQGKNGPKELLVWRQGHANPIGILPVDDDKPIELALEERAGERLPESFELHTLCDECDAWISAIGHCIDSTWTSTNIVSTRKLERRLVRLNVDVDQDQ